MTDKGFIKHKGPISTIYNCMFCSHRTSVTRPAPGSAAPGWVTGGMVSRARAEMIRHVKAEHPETPESP